MSRIITVVSILALFLMTPLAESANTGVDITFGPDSGHYRYNRDSYNEGVFDAAIDSQGRILLAFLMEDASNPGTYWPAVMRLKDDGYGDTSFGFLGLWFEGTVDASPECTVSIAVDASDRPIIGWTYEFDQVGIPNRDWYIRRLSTTGQLDAAQVVAFDIGISGSGDRIDEMEDLRVMPDGRILAIGGAQYDGSDWDMAVGVVKDDGSGGLAMDTSFSTDGRHTVNFDLAGGSFYDNAVAVTIDNTGNIVLVGWSHSSSGNLIAVSRIDKDTSAYDLTFNATGKATYFHKPLPTDPELPARGIAVTLTATGFVVGAVVTDAPFEKIGLLGLLSDGSVDMPFGTNGWYTSTPTYPGTIWTDTSSRLTGLATDYDRIIYSASINDPADPNQGQGIVGVLDMGGNPDSFFSPGGYDFYSFEPTGEQTDTGFGSVVVPSGTVVNMPVGEAILVGSMRGVTGGGSRSDQDLLATKVTTQGGIFSDDFESNGTGAWSGTSR